MDRYGFRLVVGVMTMALIVVVGAYTYNLGFARGMVESGRVIAAPTAGVPVVWHPGGFGFGFFPFFPFLFILFWVFVLRGLFWRGGWRRGYWHDGVPPAFDEWHRRAHAAETSPSRPTGTNA